MLRRLFLATFPLALMSAIAVTAPVAAQSLDYDLLVGQSFVSTGCQGPSPCDCPIFFVGELDGTFTLTFVEQQGDVAVYTLDAIDWVLLPGTPSEQTATGSGTFRINELDGTQEVDVDLTINGVPFEYSTFGPTFANPDFPDFIGVEIYSMVDVCTYDGLFLAAALVPPANEPFYRGDADGDGVVNGLVDGLFLLDFQFLGGPEPSCSDAADVDDDGVLNGLVDTLFLLAYAFTGGSPPPDPGPTICGIDPTADGLDCATASANCP